MRLGCGYLFSKEKILSGAPRGLLGCQDDGQHIFPKCQLYEQRFGFFWYGIMGIGGRYMFFNEKIFPGLPRGVTGGPKGCQGDGQHILSRYPLYEEYFRFFIVRNDEDRPQVSFPRRKYFLGPLGGIRGPLGSPR